jgi:hypothetical protein
MKINNWALQKKNPKKKKKEKKSDDFSPQMQLKVGKVERIEAKPHSNS